MSFTITVDTVRKGQDKAYAPHVTEATLTYTADRANELPHSEDCVKRHARALVGSFREAGDGATGIDAFYAPKLASLEKIDSGSDLSAVYKLVIQTPYQD